MTKVKIIPPRSFRLTDQHLCVLVRTSLTTFFGIHIFSLSLLITIITPQLWLTSYLSLLNSTFAYSPSCLLTGVLHQNPSVVVNIANRCCPWAIFISFPCLFHLAVKRQFLTLFPSRIRGVRLSSSSRLLLNSQIRGILSIYISQLIFAVQRNPYRGVAFPMDVLHLGTCIVYSKCRPLIISSLADLLNSLYSYSVLQ